MSIAVRRWGAIASSVCLWAALGALAVYGVEPSHRTTFTLDLTTGDVLLSTIAEVMCDPSGNIRLADAQTGVYAPLGGEYPTKDQCLGYWIRMNLRASGVPPGGWALEIPRDWLHAELYYDQDGHTAVLKSGSTLPPPERAFASSLLLFPLPLESNHETTFYLHLVGDTSRYGDARSIAGRIQRLDTHEAQRRNVLFGQGIYSGIILALVLYNLILYFAINERAYLYYSLYVLTFGSVWTARTGFLFQYLWPRHPLVESESQFYLVAAAIIFSSFFVRHFLATREQSKWVDRTLLSIVFFTAALCVLRIAGIRSTSTFLLAIDGLVTTIFFAVVGVLFLYRGYRPARFFLVAWALQLVGNAVYIFAFLRLMPFNFFTYNAAQIGSGVESILLAFALADRVNLLKREKEDKQLQYTRELQEQVKGRTEELTSAVEKLKTASVTDPLTGLSNRRHVDSAIQPWIAELKRDRIRNGLGTPRRYLALCVSDLDHFKLINDKLGHAVGDNVLQAAADTLRQNVRATAMLSRWGGEEFLILDHVTGPQEDLLMAERLCRAIAEDCQPAILIAIGRTLSLSLGLVRYPFSPAFPDLLTWDHCLALADHALYRAKKAGRNCWRCYRPNDTVLRNAIQVSGIDEVRRLLRTHPEQAFEMGLIEVVEQTTSDVPVS
jgi:diguanylate cyclase (GGDEF)-like protein